MPAYVVQRAQDLLNEDGKPLRGSTVLLLGVTYKPNIADQRESPAVPVARHLADRGAHVLYHDPHVEVDRRRRRRHPRRRPRGGRRRGRPRRSSSRTTGSTTSTHSPAPPAGSSTPAASRRRARGSTVCDRGPVRDPGRRALDLEEAARLAEAHGLRALGERPALRRYLAELWGDGRSSSPSSAGQSAAKYQNNRLGQLWSVLNPALLIVSYFFIFGLLLSTRQGVDNFIAFLSIGVVLFGVISSVGPHRRQGDDEQHRARPCPALPARAAAARRWP